MARRKGPGAGVRGLVRELDDQIKDLDSQIADLRGLLAERQRLAAARATLLGEPKPGAVTGAPRITQDDVAAYLEAHGPTKAGRLADALGVPLTNVSTHLYRGRGARFVNSPEGWRLVASEGGPR
jgi:hypothetical protein